MVFLFFKDKETSTSETTCIKQYLRIILSFFILNSRSVPLFYVRDYSYDFWAEYGFFCYKVSWLVSDLKLYIVELCVIEGNDIFFEEREGIVFASIGPISFEIDGFVNLFYQDNIQWFWSRAFLRLACRQRFTWCWVLIAFCYKAGRKSIKWKSNIDNF